VCTVVLYQASSDDPFLESTSRRDITPARLDDQFVLRFLSNGIDVEFQFTCRPVPLLVSGDKRRIVAAAQVIDQHLKGRAELFRFVREYFTAGLVRQIFQVHVAGGDNFVHASRKFLKGILDLLDYDSGNSGANSRHPGASCPRPCRTRCQSGHIACFLSILFWQAFSREGRFCDTRDDLC